MKLKSIHISGFKSFADRVAVFFHSGITGVIGPNGSGKSNIIDAIRWVMGEQKAGSLRADDPTDIIFSGSENRKQISMAEVTLVFSNDGTSCPAEYMHMSEISIGRRINRSGEREYFLNREPCRLRDIVDFLLSIGLGTKSYAIIQQDKRDRIIQASPEDLREIIEETAGITVFKMRRKEAEKRLESTHERLTNLADMETELARQEEGLKDQVEKAQLKLAYSTELREKEIQLLTNHIGFYRGLCQKLTTEIDSKLNEEFKQVLEATSWETDANDLKSNQLELVQQIKSQENKLDDHKIALTKYTERLTHQTRREEERKIQKDMLSNELREEQENLKREEERKEILAQEMSTHGQELAKIDSEVESLEARLEDTEESLRVERSRGDELRSEIRAIENTLNSLRARCESTLNTISKYNGNLQKITENEAAKLLTRGQLLADKNVLATDLEQISAGLDEIAGKKSRLVYERQTIDETLTTERDERDSAKQKYLEIVSHAQGLSKLVDSYSGLSDGSLAIKQKCGDRIAGFLFEHVALHPADETVLERALPSFFQSVLVENFNESVNIFDKMEEMSISRVGFLVGDMIAPISPEEEIARQNILKIRGVHCVGDRLEQASWKGLKTLFLRIFICQDEWSMHQAQKAALPFLHFLFLSERGAVCTPSQEISFGSFSSEEASQGLLARKREVALVQAQKEEWQAVLATKEGRVFKLTSEKQAVEKNLEEVQKQLDKETVESMKMTGQLENFDFQLKHLDESVARLSEEKHQLQTEMTELQSAFAQNQSQMEQLEAEQDSISQDLQHFEQEYDEKKALKDEIVTGIQSKKSTKAVLAERHANSRRNYEEISYQINRLFTKIDSHIAKIDDLKNQMEESKRGFEDLNFEIAAHEKQILQLEAQLEFLTSEEERISESLRVVEQKIKSQKDTQASRQKFVNEKQLEQARFQTILETAIKDAKEKYNLHDFDLPQHGEEQPQLVKSLESRIKELGQLLNALGAVNERALEEYTDVHNRLDFLVTQKRDIERSVNELRISIAEIEETTKGRFKEMFDKVNKEFQNLFPVLFPGGDGKLHLQNEADLLTTGMEILVRLPGKKMQNMSLFSGGEKALIAISLIFSLLKTTPAPFCFLDEVDAPLDEANVGRFNNVLEALSGDFQFVVITHNRRTMEVLDTIYGISMAEPGVSKLVSVDLGDVPSNLRKKQKAAIRDTTMRDTIKSTHTEEIPSHDTPTII